MQFLNKSAPFGVLMAASILAACQTTFTQAGSGEVKLDTRINLAVMPVL
jgi:hypothetical protein